MIGIGKFVLVAVLGAVAATPVLAAERLLSEEEEALLQPSAIVQGAKIHTSAEWQPDQYRKVMIGGATVYFAEDSKTQQIDPDLLKAVTDELEQIVATSVARYAEVVTEPGPGVALINFAIVDLKMKNKKRGLLGYTPVGLVVTTAANAAGARMTMAGARIQAETVDSVSGAVLSLSQVDQIEQLDAEKEMTWDDIRLTLQSFANRLVDLRFAPPPQ
jgi:hypothetical protein